MASSLSLFLVLVLSNICGCISEETVFLYQDFLSEKEADHLLTIVHGKRGDSVTSAGSEKVDPGKLTNNLVMPLNKEVSFSILRYILVFGLSHYWNFSHKYHFKKIYDTTHFQLPSNVFKFDEVVARIEERMSAWTFIPKENGMPLQVLNFRDEESEQNYNYFGNKSVTLSEEPLMATVVLYLSNVSRGGEILFPESENKIWSDCTKNGNALRPRKGNALVFFKAHLNATPDKSSSHSRCPVLEGEMWCAIKLFRLQAIRTERTQKFDDTDCTDEDENCARWAAVGECQRNPVFMIGSPDYYGTCRKSCNSC